MAIYTPNNPLPDTLVLIRDRRDYLLSLSDWTQAADSPLSDLKKTEWATYRQALRNLPSNYTESDNYGDVVWPPRPE